MPSGPTPASCDTAGVPVDVAGHLVPCLRLRHFWAVGHQTQPAEPRHPCSSRTLAPGVLGGPAGRSGRALADHPWLRLSALTKGMFSPSARISSDGRGFELAAPRIMSALISSRSARTFFSSHSSSLMRFCNAWNDPGACPAEAALPSFPPCGACDLVVCRSNFASCCFRSSSCVLPAVVPRSTGGAGTLPSPVCSAIRLVSTSSSASSASAPCFFGARSLIFGGPTLTTFLRRSRPFVLSRSKSSLLGAASSMVVMLAAKALACTMLVVSTEYSTCTFENSGNARFVAAPKSRRRRAPVLDTGGSYSASGASVAVAARTLVAGIPRNDARLDWNALFSGALNVRGE